MYGRPAGHGGGGDGARYGLSRPLASRHLYRQRQQPPRRLSVGDARGTLNALPNRTCMASLRPHTSLSPSKRNHFSIYIFIHLFKNSKCVDRVTDEHCRWTDSKTQNPNAFHVIWRVEMCACMHERGWCIVGGELVWPAGSSISSFLACLHPVSFLFD